MEKPFGIFRNIPFLGMGILKILEMLSRQLPL
jgi:hypothetical protein